MIRLLITVPIINLTVQLVINTDVNIVAGIGFVLNNGWTLVKCFN